VLILDRTKKRAWPNRWPPAQYMRPLLEVHSVDARHKPIRDLAASDAAGDVAMPNSGGTASSGLPAGKIRRLHLHIHPPPSPTLLRRAPALTVRSVCKGCRHFSFHKEAAVEAGDAPCTPFPGRKLRRPEAPLALLPRKAAVPEAKIGSRPTGACW
jgi:hypothetical protein